MPEADTPSPRIASHPAALAPGRSGWGKPLLWFTLPFLVLTLLSLAAAAWQVHLHHAATLDDALFPGLIDGRDLSGFRDRFKLYGSAEFFQTTSRYFGDFQSFNYGAPLAVIAHGLFVLPVDAVVLYRVIMALWLLALGVAFVLACVRRGAQPARCVALAAAVLTLSLPTVLLWRTANLELFVWLATGVGLWAWMAGRESVAAGSLGLAASLKYYPLALLAIFFSHRRWRGLALGVAVWLGATVCALWMLGPTVPYAFHGLQNEVARFGQHYLLHWQRMDNSYDHSIFGVVKLILMASGHEAALPGALRGYVVAVLLILPPLYFVKIRHRSNIDQVVALTVLSVWITPMSQDYTLVHLLVPLGWLLLDRLRHGWRHKDAVRMACFGALLSPIVFVHLGTARLGGNVKSLLLGVLFAATLQARPAIGSNAGGDVYIQ